MILDDEHMRDLRSDRALVANNRKVTKAGPLTWWYVVLADGHLLDCGDSEDGEARARAVAEKLNS